VALNRAQDWSGAIDFSDRAGALARVAAELAQALVAHPGDIGAALAAFEAPMFARAASVAEETATLFRLCFGADAPGSLIEMFTAAQPA